jgi:hypothetical protein
MTRSEGVRAAPALTEIEAICAISDPIIRNLRITQAYWEMSSALAARLGPGANWCTFATWASKQAGQTIRIEDLARAVEGHLGRSDALTGVVDRLTAVSRAIGRAADRHRISGAIHEAASPTAALARASAAVALGNLKVFEEIGREFARFLALPERSGADREDAIERFCAALRPGDPPDGQDHLQAAFRGYHRTLAATGAQVRAEGLLLANLRIGLHEQTRLQPEILEALNAPVVDHRAVRERLLEALFPDLSRLARGRVPLGPLDEAARELTEVVRASVRVAVTEKLTTLALPEETLRLGQDLRGPTPEHLRALIDRDLVTLLAAVDPSPDSTAGSGATDWASLRQRMHFIADLFRTRQEVASLLDSPFSPEQTIAIKANRRPAGRL